MKQFSVTIPGLDFKLESNKNYRIKGRIDKSSPEGFQKQGISKFQHPLNSEGAKPAFNSGMNIWDTGLYKESPCYEKEKSLGVENERIFKEHLIEDLERTMPDGALSHKENNTYWDDYKFDINQPLSVSTNTPRDFLGLWFALLGYTVAPEEKTNYPIYRRMGTSFTLVDKESKTSTKQATNLEKSKASSKFLMLLEGNKGDKVLLAKMFKYLNFRGSINTEEGILNSQFDNWIKDTRSKNARDFLVACEKFSTEEGKEELELYLSLQKAVKDNKIALRRGEYYLGEDSIGNNLKIAADTVNKSDNLKSVFLEIINNDN